MNINLKTHYLEIHQDNISDKNKKINLLLDWDNRDKFMKVAKNLAGENGKTPINHRGNDTLLTVTVSDVVLCYLNGSAAALSDLLGNEITVNLKLQRYSLTSKFEKNKGEKITGVSAKLIKAECQS